MRSSSKDRDRGAHRDKDRDRDMDRDRDKERDHERSGNGYRHRDGDRYQDDRRDRDRDRDKERDHESSGNGHRRRDCDIDQRDRRDRDRDRDRDRGAKDEKDAMRCSASAPRNGRGRDGGRHDKEQAGKSRPQQLDFEALIPGYRDMSEAQRMKARTKLLLAKTSAKVSARVLQCIYSSQAEPTMSAAR